MFYKKNSYIYLEARVGISYREDFQKIDTHESFGISRESFDSIQNAFKKNVLGFIFEISTFKVLFQNAFFENTFISEKHVVPTKIVWLKDRSF